MEVTLYHGSSEMAEGPTLTDTLILRADMPGGAIYTGSRENGVPGVCNDAVLPDRHGCSSARISQEEWWPESNGGTLTFMEVLSAMGTPIGIGMSCQGS